MSKHEYGCEHCGAEHDEWECLEVRTSQGSLVVVDGKSVDICFFSCLECALPNVWYVWRAV